MIEDKLLIWKLKRGEQAALREIYEKHKNGLLKLAVFLINDAQSSEDIVHDVFVSFSQASAKGWNKIGLRKINLFELFYVIYIFT